ncbi:IclR family transcriptional regulator [Actinocorallia sp. A-T 12471]|uniref:IclR family transcriptional regulator n=1 Tax=Actinocorallia sp. A-T 12471 TaxID=3089813 RepID=UPI0029CAD476|nr:IclR family transcriptional regulator [Actinocorallia sp. A-T 12471]MDX6741515.1 IclR family transcriptional regulator [Actinocorallia sp. A-T 12471]
MTQRTQSVDRALAVLRAFRDGGPTLGISELSRRLELSTSTAHRLARSLVTAGFLEQDAAGARYRLGPTVAELGQLGFHQRGLHRAGPELAALGRATSTTVDLAMHSEREALILVGDSVRPDTGLGLRRPLHSTALGKVLLAWSPPSDLDDLGPLPAMTDRTIVDPAELREELAQVREDGYAVNDGESQDGVRTLAVPVLDRAGHARYALAVRSTPAVITTARLAWFVTRAHACARALEIVLLSPEERWTGRPD